MRKQRGAGTELCFRCGEHRVGVLDSRPGTMAYPWRRRHRLCTACGSRWSTLEILAPDDPLAREVKEALAALDAPPPPPLISPATEAVSLLAADVRRSWLDPAPCR